MESPSYKCNIYIIFFGVLVKSDLTSKDASLLSSGICTVLTASIKLSVDCSLCRGSSVKG